jgi:acetolactate synthase-1/2/3 large subunit
MMTTETNPVLAKSASHAFLSVLAAQGLDRVFLVPGESYLGVLDALCDFPAIDVVTCRHESGAGFMACADGRLTRRPALVMVSRGPGASNAAIAVHTAQQDAIPLILVIGQVPADSVRRESFQEIDYQKMFGSMAKWVYEARHPEQLAEMAFKAVRVATSGTPGPVVLVIPEDLQQQPVPLPDWRAVPHAPAMPAPDTLAQVRQLLVAAQRPLIIAGGCFDQPGGREVLKAFAEAWQIPVALSFRRHDVFDNTHPLYAGDLGLSNRRDQMETFNRSDLVLALGTRLDDITTQGYSFPCIPQPDQDVVFCYPDDRVVGRHFAPRVGVVCDAVELARALLPAPAPASGRDTWISQACAVQRQQSIWPSPQVRADGVNFVDVVHSLARQAPADVLLCLDAGTFAAPVYKHFPFVYPQRLMAPLAGAMGYGTPAAVACALRYPGRKVVCLVGDGGFMMTGNEMIAAVERRLPILFILADNNCYGSIRLHQEVHYPGRHAGTSLFNPDFQRIAMAFGMAAESVTSPADIDAALARGLAAPGPHFLHVHASLSAILPKRPA